MSTDPHFSARLRSAAAAAGDAQDCEAAYRAIVESAPVAIFVCDCDAVIQIYNQAAVDLWGREPKRGVEKHCGSLRLFLPDGTLLPHDRTPLRRVIETGIAVSGVEVVIERPDGKRLPVLVSFAALRDRDGNVTGAVTSFHDISERKRAEERLLESEARYQTLFASIDEGFCVAEILFDASGQPFDSRFLEVNPAFEAQSGLRNALGRTMRELVPGHEEHWFQTYGRVVTTGEPVRFEAHARALHRWFDVYAFRLGGAESRRVAILFQDITERKETEDRLRATTDDLNAEMLALKRLHAFSARLVGTRELQSLLEEVLDAAIALEGAQSGFVQLLDSESNALVVSTQRGFPVDFSAGSLFAHQPLCAQALAKREHVILADTRLDPSGTARAKAQGFADYRALHITPLHSREGEPLGVIAVLFADSHQPSDRDLRLADLYAQMAADLIERRQSEEALRQSEERYRALVHAAMNTVWRMSGDGRTILELHRRGEDPNHVSREPFKAWLDRGVPAEERAPLAARWQQAIDDRAFFEHEHSTIAENGQVRRWHSRAVPMLDERGDVSEWVGASIDITDRKRTEEELRRTLENLESRVEARTAELAASNKRLREEMRERQQTERARQQLLERLVSAEDDERRRISRELHDQVGQQLTALSLGLKAIAPHLSPSAGDALLQLEAIAESISKEVHDLALELRPTALDDVGLSAALPSYIDAWSARTHILAALHQVALESRLSSALEITVYRIVQEALTNVARHARGQRVSVVVERREDHVLIIVEDDGVGFDVEAVFGNRSAKRLGLLGMMERAHACGGTVNFESIPGRGTAVYGHLPLR